MERKICRLFEKLILNRKAAVAFIAVAALVVFSPTFFNGFMTAWDDQWQVVNRFTDTGFEWNNIKYVFTQAYMRQYSPLNQCVYIVLYLIGGYNAALFHGASLVVHIGNAILVYVLLERILRTATNWNAWRIMFVSFFTGLVFAVNPVQVESVAWVSASKIVFCTFFYLLATLAFINCLLGKGMRYYVLCMVMLILSYGFKEHVVVFALWATVLCLIYNVGLRKRKTLLMLVPLYAVCLLLGLVYVFCVNSYPEYQIENYEWWQRTAFLCYSLVEYVCKWVVPFNLQYLYIFPTAVDDAVPVWMISYPILLVIVCIVFRRQLLDKPVLYGLAFFVIHLILVLHIIPLNRVTIVADRYNYLSGAGLSFVMAYAVTACREKCGKAARVAIRGVLVLLLAYYSCMTFFRVQDWKTTDTIRKDVNSVCNINNNKTTRR